MIFVPLFNSGMAVSVLPDVPSEASPVLPVFGVNTRFIKLPPFFIEDSVSWVSAVFVKSTMKR